MCLYLLLGGNGDDMGTDAPTSSQFAPRKDILYLVLLGANWLVIWFQILKN